MMQLYIEDAAYYRINTSTRTPAAMFCTTMLVEIRNFSRMLQDLDAIKKKR
jgi:hypothetical protein